MTCYPDITPSPQAAAEQNLRYWLRVYRDAKKLYPDTCGNATRFTRTWAQGTYWPRQALREAIADYRRVLAYRDAGIDLDLDGGAP